MEDFSPSRTEKSEMNNFKISVHYAVATDKKKPFQLNHYLKFSLKVPKEKTFVPRTLT